MLRRHRLLLLLFSLLTLGLAPGSAQAASVDPNGFHLQSTALSVHENAGSAVITVQRTNVAPGAQIRYIVLGRGVPCGDGPSATLCSADADYDFTSVKGMLDFAPGVASMSFNVPIVDHGLFALPKTIKVSLFGASPIGLAAPSSAVLTIINDDPAPPRDPANPLALPTLTRELGANLPLAAVFRNAATLARVLLEPSSVIAATGLSWCRASSSYLALASSSRCCP